jgi:hypothetical protein
MSDGFDFLGFHIQWRRKYGTNQWYVYTFIAHRPIRSLKAKIRALTNRTSQQNPRDVLIRLNQIIRGWANTSSTRCASTPCIRWLTSPGGVWSSGGGRCTAGGGRTSGAG